MSDYNTIFEYWCNPQTNLTHWRHYIEDMLQNDARWSQFVIDARAHKHVSTLHRACYLRLKYDNIGMSSINKEKILSKLELCLNAEPDHPCIQESVGRILAENYCLIPQSPQLERAKTLLSTAAYVGNKNAIRHLVTASYIVKCDDYSNLFSHLGLDQDTDPYYKFLCQYYRHAGGKWDTSLLEPLMEMDMPLNTGIISMISMVFMWMDQIYTIANMFPLEQNHMSAFLEEVKLDFMKLYSYIEPYLKHERMLPRQRDPFRMYPAEFSAGMTQTFARAAEMYRMLL